MLRWRDGKLAFLHLLVTMLDTLTRNLRNPQRYQIIESGLAKTLTLFMESRSPDVGNVAKVSLREQ